MVEVMWRSGAALLNRDPGRLAVIDGTMNSALLTEWKCPAKSLWAQVEQRSQDNEPKYTKKKRCFGLTLNRLFMLRNQIKMQRRLGQSLRDTKDML